jgi:(S)-2-hydroxy-acid oxidase
MDEKKDQRKSGLQVPIDPITLSEVASVAKSLIKKEVWDYYDCGADSQTALHENEAAFKV